MRIARLNSSLSQKLVHSVRSQAGRNQPRFHIGVVNRLKAHREPFLHRDIHNAAPRLSNGSDPAGSLPHRDVTAFAGHPFGGGNNVELTARQTCTRTGLHLCSERSYRRQRTDQRDRKEEFRRHNAPPFPAAIYRTSSIRNGPRREPAYRNRSAKAPTESARAASTPCAS